MTDPQKTTNKALVIINPVAGFINGDQMKKICEEQFRAAGWRTSFHITKIGDDLDTKIQNEIKSGVNLVVAVGGDGTVAAVAACLLHSKIPLGIIPTGTWNAIARYLAIPASPQRAIALMTGKHSIRRLDMMAIGNTVHAMNMGIGFSASMINGADREQKRKLGNLAYFKRAFKQLLGLQMQRYIIQADGAVYKGRATEIFVANYGMVGLHILEDRLNILPDDGIVEILILRARTILDLPVLIWQIFIKREKRTPKYRKIPARKHIRIKTSPPAQVQADGELLGLTPVSVKVLPKIIRVIAP